MSRLKDLKLQLKQAQEELDNAGHSKPQFLIEDDDEYQDQLELGWAKEELRDQIEHLKAQIELYTSDSL